MQSLKTRWQSLRRPRWEAAGACSMEYRRPGRFRALPVHRVSGFLMKRPCTQCLARRKPLPKSHTTIASAMQAPLTQPREHAEAVQLGMVKSQQDYRPNPGHGLASRPSKRGRLETEKRPVDGRARISCCGPYWESSPHQQGIAHSAILVTLRLKMSCFEPNKSRLLQIEALAIFCAKHAIYRPLRSHYAHNQILFAVDLKQSRILFRSLSAGRSVR